MIDKTAENKINKFWGIIKSKTINITMGKMIFPKFKE